MPGRRFRAPQLALSALLAPVLLLSACGGSESEAPRHVVLISIDTLRADHLSCYGYGRPTSPALDALAAEGARFERCVASSSWTLPSHLTMLTGLPIGAHGIDHDGLWQRTDADGQPIAPDLRGRFLAETLRAFYCSRAEMRSEDRDKHIAYLKMTEKYNETYEW